MRNVERCVVWPARDAVLCVKKTADVRKVYEEEFACITKTSW